MPMHRAATHQSLHKQADSNSHNSQSFSSLPDDSTDDNIDPARSNSNLHHATSLATPAHINTLQSPAAVKYPVNQELIELINDDSVEHSIVTILNHTAFNSILPRIFSYLSVVELMFIASVNKRWHELVNITCAEHIDTLNLCQFWSRIGVLDTRLFRGLVSKFHHVRHLNLAYCHKLNTDTLIDIITAIPQHQSINKLNLFYCYELNDDSIDVVLQLLPKLTELNVGRCMTLTNRSIDLLSDCNTLRKLVIVANPNIDIEITNYLDDPTKFKGLRVLNVVNCTKLKQDIMNECKANRPNLRIIGPDHLIIQDSAGRKLKAHKDLDSTLND